MSTPLEQAVEILGSYEAMGRLCGVSGKAVVKWRQRGRLPRTEWTGETHYAERISEATGIALKALRPDVFGEPPASFDTSGGGANRKKTKQKTMQGTRPQG